MEEYEKKSSEVTPPVYILLPVCIEMQCDLFMNFLQNILAKGKKKNWLDDAFKTGMDTEEFEIENEDIEEHWQVLKSKEQQIRQAKLLGYWCASNFPSLAKRQNVRPHVRKCVTINRNGSMQPDDIDKVVFRKLKIRIIELNVSQSTLSNLKNFVKVPNEIGRYNAVQISPRKSLFDINDGDIQLCWDALKSGKFSLNVEVSESRILYYDLDSIFSGY